MTEIMSQNIYRFQGMNEFQCLQDKCENTCCAGWSIDIDESTKGRYKKNYPELYEVIVSTGNNSAMPQNELGECASLKKGMCNIHNKYGEEALPETCNEYPRKFFHVNDLEIQHVLPSCPEAARILFLSDKPLTLERKDKSFLRGAGPSGETIQIEGLESQKIVEVFESFVGFFLNSKKAAEDTLLDFLLILEGLNTVPMSEWAEIISVKKNDTPEKRQKHFDQSNTDVSETIVLIQDILDSQVHMFPSDVRAEIECLVTEVVKHNNIVTGWSQEIMMDRMDYFLKRHLAISVMALSLPFRSQSDAGKKRGMQAINWGKAIAMQFVIVRFIILGLARKSESLTDAQIIDVVHRLYRVFCHTAISEKQKEFMEKDIKHISQQVLRFIP